MQVPNRFYNGSDYRYGFNGKEKDNELKGEGNSIDYGFRMYDPRIGRFFSVDPLFKDYPELTPFQFSSNTPIWAIDLDGLEAYFSNSGVFQKWGVDRSKTAPVIIVETNQTLALNVTQLLDRAHWIFGEGRGEFANEYAHTMQNIREWGYHGNGFSEAEIYLSMVDNKYSGKDEFFSGNTGYVNYDDFSNARANVEDLNDLKNASIVIKAVIDQQTGVTEDPTPDAIQWLGKNNRLTKAQIKKGVTETKADKSYNLKLKQYGKEKVLRKDGATRSHIFYNSKLQKDIDAVKKRQSKNQTPTQPKSRSKPISKPNGINLNQPIKT
jgi:RHS repeat-associated protein